MFVVVIHYTKPLAEVDAARPAHIEWIKKYSDAGTIVLSGRQTSAGGGVVIAEAPSRAALDAILAEDNYIKAGVARHEVIEFAPTGGSLVHALTAPAK